MNNKHIILFAFGLISTPFLVTFLGWIHTMSTTEFYFFTIGFIAATSFIMLIIIAMTKYNNRCHHEWEDVFEKQDILVKRCQFCKELKALKVLRSKNVK